MVAATEEVESCLGGLKCCVFATKDDAVLEQDSVVDDGPFDTIIDSINECWFLAEGYSSSNGVYW